MQKKIPMRQCLGCREMKPKRDMIRVVRSSEGQISIDFKGKMPGRGAYVCPDKTCLKKAISSKALERNFEMAVPKAVYDSLLQQMEDAYGV